MGEIIVSWGKSDNDGIIVIVARTPRRDADCYGKTFSPEQNDLRNDTPERSR